MRAKKRTMSLKFWLGKLETWNVQTLVRGRTLKELDWEVNQLWMC